MFGIVVKLLYSAMPNQFEFIDEYHADQSGKMYLNKSLLFPDLANDILWSDLQDIWCTELQDANASKVFIVICFKTAA